jgi:hypothetical protein
LIKFVRRYFAVTVTGFVLTHPTLQIVPSGRRAVASEVSTQPTSVDAPAMMPPLTASNSLSVRSFEVSLVLLIIFLHQGDFGTYGLVA